MNTRPTAKTILCYGDSNTWGQKPDKSGRYAADIRWPGVLQDTLGEQYYVIEEGLSSRTTDLDYSAKPGRNGRTYLEPCLDSHSPLDLVVLMLGTNDLKIEFDRNAQDIAAATEGLIEIIQANIRKRRTPTKILLASPILVDGTAPNFARFYTGTYDATSAAKSKQLAAELQAVAARQDCAFIDAAQYAKAGDDGIHWDEPSHPAFGSQLAEKVRGLLA